MYVVTFYSFKGGVGRTMAMVNVGLELAKNGRRVLMVDFDLEAPGLNTFNLPKPTTTPPGIVDYVLHYLKNDKADDVEKYIYECTGEGGKDGGLWIMPAGLEQHSYASSLNSIDWGTLYRQHDGYLLFENLKEQWRLYLAPDYVLVDSRTGYTDVAGICTRQLPDAVVALFFPTTQNLMGLEKVVKDIRAESAGPRDKSIQLHFVTANVPDIDDENKILADRMNHFRQSFGYKTLASTIHHYPSLDLLNQEVFISKHPNSRLAREYRSLMLSIIRANPEDREGALGYLERIVRNPSGAAIRAYSEHLDEKLDGIVSKHSNDVEVLRTVAEVETLQGRFDDAIVLLTNALAIDPKHPVTLLRRAELSLLAGDEQSCVQDVRSLLESSNADYFLINRSLRLLKSSIDETNNKGIVHHAQSPAVRALSCEERVKLANELQGDTCFMPFSKAILEEGLIDPACEPEAKESIGHALALIEIAEHDFVRAKELLLKIGEEQLKSNIRNLFNYAVCEWALNESIPTALFKEIADLDRTIGKHRTDVNYLQCIAISYWASHSITEANDLIARARQRSMVRGRSIFSCWTYTSVTQAVFSNHLDNIMRMFEGESIWPLGISSQLLEASDA